MHVRWFDHWVVFSRETMLDSQETQETMVFLHLFAIKSGSCVRNVFRNGLLIQAQARRSDSAGPSWQHPFARAIYSSLSSEAKTVGSSVHFGGTGRLTDMTYLPEWDKGKIRSPILKIRFHLLFNWFVLLGGSVDVGSCFTSQFECGKRSVFQLLVVAVAPPDETVANSMAQGEQHLK